MMISAEKLKDFLVHRDEFVRQQAAGYFHKGWIIDDDIVPLAFEACDKYGYDENAAVLLYCHHQYISPEYAAKLLEVAPDVEELFGFHIAVLLNKADINFVAENIEEMERIFKESGVKPARYRLEGRNKPPQQLWAELEEHARKVDELKDEAEADFSYFEVLCDLLIEHRYPEPEQILEMLGSGKYQNSRIETALIILAGGEKIEAAVPQLLDFLDREEDEITEVAEEALARISSSETMELIKEDFTSRSEPAQLKAASVLGKIKLPESEEAIIELLENKKRISDSVRNGLIFSLCDLFSNRAFPWAKKLAADQKSDEGSRAREYLVVLSEVFGFDLPHKAQWRHSLISGYRQLRKQRREFFDRLKQRIQESVEQPDVDEILDEPLEEDEYEPDGNTPVFPPGKSDSKIRRNDPCHCGSGKKYKKCCGRPGRFEKSLYDRDGQ